MSEQERVATMMAGIPARNMSLYHRTRFLVGDPAVIVEIATPEQRRSILIVRDIEMERARRFARADQVACPADFTPEGGLSGDRETATAQAAAELVRRHGVALVVADRSLPLIYAQMLTEIGIEVSCDLEMGVVDRRAKDEQEITYLSEAQHVTEQVMRRACQLVARATADAEGLLWHDGQQLTAERVRRAIDIWLLEQGYTNPGSIVAGGKQGGDCHELGSGPLRTAEPVIIDIFPQNQTTLYNGDCTRTVVHGSIPDAVVRMHAAVVAAKAAGIAAIRAGVTGQQVHEAVLDVVRAHGYGTSLPKADAPETDAAMVHGTGHGVGLEVHEPPLLDNGGPELVDGDAVTVEPGIYSKAVGGVRVEDMVIVGADGCRNLNELPEHLTWD